MLERLQGLKEDLERDFVSVGSLRVQHDDVDYVDERHSESELDASKDTL